MDLKKYILLVVLLVCAFSLYAQEAKPGKEKRIFIPDSTSIDSLKSTITTAKTDTLDIMPIEELEEYIVSLQDTFFSYETKSFLTDEYYSFGNNRYVVPDHEGSIDFLNVRLDNYAQPKKQFYPLLNYFVLQQRNDNYNLSPLQNSIRALLTDVQYGNGDYNNEDKRIGFIKNRFLELADLQLYAHSGEHTSPWGKKSYFDNFVFHVQKNLLTKSFSSHTFSYSFFKMFSALETYNVFNPEYPGTAQKYFQKTENISNIASASLFDKIFNVSFLHQYNRENVTGQFKNTLNRYQFNIGINLPMEEYATKLLLRADVQDMDNVYYDGWLHDYLVRVEINSPGIFADFYSIKIINDVIFSQKPDTTFIMPELIFDIPITESIHSSLSVGARRKEKNFYYDGQYALNNKTKVIFTEGTIDIHSNPLKLRIGAFYEEFRNDGQWQWLSSSSADSPYYKEFDNYHIYGGNLSGELAFNYLTIDSHLRFSGMFSQRPDSLVNYPAYRAKVEWTNKRHFTHKNFIYANADLSYLGNTLDIEGTKIDHQLFCNAEVGLSIKRFMIYLKLTNIFNILDSNYFMFRLNEVNPFGVGFGVQWNFIN
ncbi:MAG: hypothetical protein JW794_07480 [Candidatus Cloacimonetes bacterium]|nr:hypothetical protein [Candidatus Cloacimonadota bacterium]